MEFLTAAFRSLSLEDPTGQAGTYTKLTNEKGNMTSNPTCEDRKKNKNKNSGSCVEKCCSACGRTVDLQTFINNTTATNEDLVKENEALRASLLQTRTELQELTDKMASVYKKHNLGSTESAVNKFSPSNVADMLQSVHDDLFQYIVDRVQEDKQREAMEYLTLLLRDSFEFCNNTARLQIHKLLRPRANNVTDLKQQSDSSDDESEKGRWEEGSLNKYLSEADRNDVFRLRFQLAQIPDVVDNVKAVCREYCSTTIDKASRALTKMEMSSKDADDTTLNDMTTDLLEYFDQCTQCCWLAVTNCHSTQFRFCCTHEKYDDGMKKCFQVVERDENPGLAANAVTQLVWPAVVQERKDKQDKLTVYKMGYVYVNAAKFDRTRKSNIASPGQSQRKESLIN